VLPRGAVVRSVRSERGARPCQRRPWELHLDLAQAVRGLAPRRHGLSGGDGPLTRRGGPTTRREQGVGGSGQLWIDVDWTLERDRLALSLSRHTVRVAAFPLNESRIRVPLAPHHMRSLARLRSPFGPPPWPSSSLDRRGSVLRDS
jgi:hypothetical protein